MAEQQLRGRRERAAGGKRLQENWDVVLSDHHAAEHHKGRNRRSHTGEILAEQPSVEWQRRERAGGNRRAGPIGVIIRMFWRRAEFHVRARLQIVERGGARHEKRLALLKRARANLGIEETPRLTDVIRHTVAHGLAGTRYPDRSGRRGCCAADLIGLPAEKYVEAVEGCYEPSRHAAPAVAKDQ